MPIHKSFGHINISQIQGSPAATWPLLPNTLISEKLTVFSGPRRLLVYGASPEVRARIFRSMQQARLHGPSSFAFTTIHYGMSEREPVTKMSDAPAGCLKLIRCRTSFAYHGQSQSSKLQPSPYERGQSQNKTPDTWQDRPESAASSFPPFITQHSSTYKSSYVGCAARRFHSLGTVHWIHADLKIDGRPGE